jgi:signal transduction histidine kinase
MRAADGASPRRGLVLTVEDDGPGIPDRGKSSLLERGRRLDESKPGQGIGLSVVVELAEAYGGGVEVGRSDLGGARVTVRLPPG